MTQEDTMVPLTALSDGTKVVISTLLNPPKVIPSENGLPRDWRGFAHLCDLGGETMPSLASNPDPSGRILAIWQQQGITIKEFEEKLKRISRWDILDDTMCMLKEDAARYLEHQQKVQQTADTIENSVDERILTIDDLHRLRQGLENQYYDAFLLYADEDSNFATEVIDKLENEYNLRLCLKDRDLIGGITFEHEAIMTLISERCNRLIVIVSSNFLKSPANKFFLNYAQALGIDKRQRKVIPCLYEKCELPPQLSYMFVLDYNRTSLYNFWGKLRDSVQVPSTTNYQQNIQSTDCASIPMCPSTGENSLLSIKKHSVDLTSQVVKIPPSQNIKKSCNLLQWTKKKWSGQVKENYSTLTIDSLPSLAVLEEPKKNPEIKTKKNFMNKCAKKMRLKKILSKS
ncbi:hypothetical protein KM043_015724 [Ampulex compressa]|nr:hypothetical protein KM043_015724 [Ampulex compressa]